MGSMGTEVVAVFRARPECRSDSLPRKNAAPACRPPQGRWLGAATVKSGCRYWAKVVRWPLDAGLEKLVHHRLGSLVLRLDRCVQAAEARDGPIDQVPHAVLVADVCAEEFDFSAECAQLSREVLAGLLVATGDNDAVAFPRESKSRGAPDSSQRAGNQNNVGAHAVSPPRYGQPEGRAFKIAPVD